jgi:hypothetical protein
MFAKLGVGALLNVGYIEPSVINTNVCNNFVVTVYANVTYQITFFEFVLIFNPAQMHIVPPVVVRPPWTQPMITYGPNSVWVQGTAPPTPPIGPGKVPLADITFHCDTPGSSLLGFDLFYVTKLGGTMISLPTEGGTVNQYDFYWKPGNLVDYAPSGVPDFDQKQDAWINPRTGQWSYCGPTAIANSFWWLDSFYEPSPVAPPSINDHFPLVWSYNPQWDDHDPRNVGPLISDLSWYMDTDGKRTGSTHNGTRVVDMAGGIDQYLLDHGLYNKFYQKTVKAPDFFFIEKEVEKCEDVTLLLGFWQTSDGINWWRVGGHYVTVAGVDSAGLWIGFSDPCIDNAEAGGLGVVLPGPHGFPHPSWVHNDTQFVSHDVYAALIPGNPNLGGSPGNPNFEVNYNEYEIVNWTDLISNTMGQNSPSEFEGQTGPYLPGLKVFTEVEYAVIVSCKTGIVAAGCEDTNVYVWDFFGNLQWQWATTAPVLSVALDNEAKYLVSGSRHLPDGPGVLSFFDAQAVTGGGLNMPLWAMQLNISESYDGGWMGTESKSVDVKYNSYNASMVVAAATDQGLYLFDQWGNQIFHYWDEDPEGTVWPETIVRISQDGNYIVCASHDGPGRARGVHYFSHLRDGIPGWGPADGTPIWDFYMLDTAGVFWVAISGLGDYVAVSGWYTRPMGAYVTLLNGSGSQIWIYSLALPGRKGGYVRVDMPCDGRSVVCANDDPNNGLGTDLLYFNDGGNGWDGGDGTPVWSFWPGKPAPQNTLDDFYTVAISENGDYIATGGLPPNVYLLTKAGALQQTIATTPSYATQSVDLTFTGKYGAAGDTYGVVWFFDKDTGFKWSRNTDYNAPIHSIAVSKIYPCMFPYPNHDVAVTNVKTSKTGCLPIPVIGHGYILKINVTLANQGDYTETFNVIVYANTTAIASQSLSLSSGSSTSIIFSYNTTGLSKGTYTIWATASIVQNEIDVYDNTYTDGLIAVSVVGDINGDFKVDIEDLVRVIKYFGSYPGHPTKPWNPNADINCDNKVDIEDLVLVIKHFGEHYP